MKHRKPEESDELYLPAYTLHPNKLLAYLNPLSIQPIYSILPVPSGLFSGLKRYEAWTCSRAIGLWNMAVQGSEIKFTEKNMGGCLGRLDPGRDLHQS